MTSRKILMALALFLTFAGTLVLPPAARADGMQDVLKLVPDDAWGFVVVRSLNTVDEKAKVLQDIFGPIIHAPVTPMALGMLNLGDTLDMTRPLAIVMLDVQKFGGPDKAGVALIPAKDSKALLQKLAAPAAAKEDQEEKPAADKPKPKKADDEGDDEDEGEDEDEDEAPLPEGITKCAIMGQPSFAAINEKAKIVILGSSADAVLKVSKAKKTLAEGFDKTRAAALGKADVYLSVSVSKVLTAYKGMVMPLLQMAMAASDPSGQTAQELIKMFEEMAAIDIALGLDKEGVTFVVLTLPEKDSDLEKWMKDTKNSTESLLKVLPKEKFLFAAGGTAAYSEHAEKFGGGGGLTAMLKNTGLAGLEEKAVKKIEEGLKSLGKIVEAWAISASALPAGDDGMVGLTIVIETKDPEEFVGEFRKVYKAVWEISDDEDLAKAKESIVHTPDAETIGENKIDTIVVKLDGLAEMGDLEEDDLAKIEKVLGKEIAVRFGPAGDKHVVLAFGGGKQRFQAVCDGLKSPGAGLSADATIKAMGGRLPKARASEAYIAVDNILLLAKDLAKTMGEEAELSFEVPTIDAPLAFSSTQVGSVQQMDIIVPMKLITAVKELVAQQMSAGAAAFDEEEEEEEEEEEGKDEAEAEEDEGDDEDDDEAEEDEDEEGDKDADDEEDEDDDDE